VQSPALTLDELQPHLAWGSITDTQPMTQIGFHMHRVKVVDKAVWESIRPCRIRGLSVMIENSAGSPGHIGHFVEPFMKLPELEVFRGQWENALFSSRSSAWVNDYERGIIEATVAPFKELSVHHKETNLHCEFTCIEHLIWPQTKQQWFTSTEGANKFRASVLQYCGIPERHAPHNPPRLQFIPRFTTRRVMNSPELLGWAASAGFDVAPVPANLTHFCDQIALFHNADVVISMHSSALTTVFAMRPGSTVIEMSAHGFYWPCFKVIGLHNKLHYLEWGNTNSSLQSPGEPKQADVQVDSSIRPFLQAAFKLSRSSQTLLPVPSDECEQLASSDDDRGGKSEQPIVRCDDDALHRLMQKL